MQTVIAILLIVVLAAAGVLFLDRPLRVPVNGQLPENFPEGGFSHRAFEELLKVYVRPGGSVDYAGWHASPDAVNALNAYVLAVAHFSPENAPARFPDRSAELAYWMYGYNAYVIKSVIDNWPITSVTDIKAPIEAVKGLGFFHRLRFSFGGKYMSLLAVENDIIRRRFQDPRVHFVLNCASDSCPIARPELPTGDELEALLEKAAVEFISDPRNVAVDHQAQEVNLSRIFKWYRKDFVNHARLHGVPGSEDALDYIRSIAPKSLARELGQAAGYRIVYRDYDWSLNTAV